MTSQFFYFNWFHSIQDWIVTTRDKVPRKNKKKMKIIEKSCLERTQGKKVSVNSRFRDTMRAYFWYRWRDDITYQCLKNVFRKTISTAFAFYTSSQMKKRVTYSVLLNENHYANWEIFLLLINIFKKLQLNQLMENGSKTSSQQNFDLF